MKLVRFICSAILPLSTLLAASAAHAQDHSIIPDQPYGLPDARLEAETPKAPVAPEPPAPRFGERGEVVLAAASGGANGAGISYESFSGSSATYLSAGGEVGLDYFLVDHFSLGFDVSANYSNSVGYGADSSLVSTKSTSFSGGVRFGADLPLGDTFSFYPRLTLGILETHQDESLVSGQSLSVAASAVGASETSQVGPWMNLFAPLLVHPTPHFFLGAGPRVSRTFANTIGAAPGVSGQPTTLGASFVFGGYWGGDEPVASTEPPTSRTEARARRFGDQGTFVITNDTDGYALSTGYAGTSASNLNILVEPGFDYFVTDHFSIGLDLWAMHSKSVGFDASGNQIMYSSTGFGFAPRFGFDVPITDALSWYPRASIGLGPLNQDETSNGAENQHTYTRLFVNLEAPLLVHVARHFFVGAGPTVYHELSSTDQNDVSNQATQFGASALVGGWL